MTDKDTRTELPLEVEAEADEATKAFEALRKAIDKRSTVTAAELKTIRKGVEALFDQLEKLEIPPDYTKDLSKLVQGSLQMAERLTAIEASPLMRDGGASHARLMERTGESLVKTAAFKLEQQADRLAGAVSGLTAHTLSAVDRRTQDLRLHLAAGVGFVVGMAVLLLIPQVLPFDVDSHVAAAVMGKDRWEAGSQMMKVADPASWAQIAADARLGKDNADVVAKCRQVAKKTGQTQKCTVKVTPGNN